MGPRPGGQLLSAGEELGWLLPMSAGAEAGLGRAFLLLGPRGPGHGWEAVVLRMGWACQGWVQGGMRLLVVGGQGWMLGLVRHVVAGCQDWVHGVMGHGGCHGWLAAVCWQQ